MLKRILVLDFDGTITTKDTTSLIGESVYRLKDVKVPWNHYTKVYEAHHVPKPRSLGTNPWITVCNYERDAKSCELASINELEAQDHFKDVVIQDLLQVVKPQVQVRPGLREMMGQFHETYIVSLNWSKDLIHDLTGVRKGNIFCNDLISRDNVTYNGYFTKQVVTGLDKYNLLKDKILDPKSEVTYIGDSFGDLPCILAEGVKGYIIGDSLKHLQLDVPTIQGFDEVQC
ncbi:hypothetical protein KLU848_1544 [Kluyveromyces marxianus]